MCFDIFDHIYCIHYVPYYSRLDIMKSLLDGLGILNSSRFSFFYTSLNIFYDRLYRYMLKHDMITGYDYTKEDNKEGYILNSKVFNLAMNVYNLLIQAYELGYERILVLEDDITFLKDQEQVFLIMSDYPLDYDIVSMEYWFRNKNDLKTAFSEARKINESFYKIKYERLVNFSCVGLSRVGIKHIIDNMNLKFICSDYYIAYQDKAFADWRIRRAVSKTPICLQAINNVSNHGADSHGMVWKYTSLNNVVLSDYNGYEHF